MSNIKNNIETTNETWLKGREKTLNTETSAGEKIAANEADSRTCPATSLTYESHTVIVHIKGCNTIQSKVRSEQNDELVKRQCTGIMSQSTREQVL
jgi:hypothetical protein